MLPYEHVEAVLNMIRRLGLDDLIASEPSRQRDLVAAMVVERPVFPRSKLAHTRQGHDTTWAEELDVADATENPLDEAIDCPLQRQPAIEKELVEMPEPTADRRFYRREDAFGGAGTNRGTCL